MFEGLMDPQDTSSFDIKLKTIKERWRNHDPLKSDQFFDWFVQYESGIMKETILEPIRKAAGLKDPPVQFSMNASESVNAVRKANVDCKCSELPAFIHKVEELINQNLNVQLLTVAIF